MKFTIKRLSKVFIALIIISLITACAQTTKPTVESEGINTPEGSEVLQPTEVNNEDSSAGEVVEEEAEPMELITWYAFDQNNVDPASDERVGNEYLRKTIPEFNEEFDGKIVWTNVPKAWDKIPSELAAAVIAGGDVPDLVQQASVTMFDLFRNGAIQDLRPWAEQQSWWNDMDPSAIATCVGPDGGLYCLPIAMTPSLTYVWADHFPNGWPKTPEDFLVDAERLKEQDVAALTFFGSTAYDGSGATRAIWSFISSFGGTYSDDQGNLTLNNPENITAIEFLRDIVAKGYVTETTFAGSFQEEEAFKDASAAAIPTGLFGYRYINPLTAPDGTKYEKGSSEDMLDAISAGDVILEPMFAPEGKTPGCNNASTGFMIPTGAKNAEAAYAYLNWLMEDLENNAEFVVGPGAGFPALQSTINHPDLQTPFYQEAFKALETSLCKPFQGSLTNPSEARILIMQAVYKLIKEDPNADIKSVLQAADEEYNSNN